MNIPTPHITADANDFASTVLMPGDPKRARFIAKNFLTHAELVNDVRGVQGYTGYYKGKRVSVMASGMGMPSIGIYSYELFNFYGVDNIIRVGSAGALQDGMRIRDIVIAQGACTNSNFAAQYGLIGTYTPIASYKLLRKAADTAERMGLRYYVGNVYSSDTFYDASNGAGKWRDMGVLAIEMEAAALYMNAARAGKNALCICTISDCIFGDPSKDTTADERETGFTNMMELALEIAE